MSCHPRALFCVQMSINGATTVAAVVDGGTASGVVSAVRMHATAHEAAAVLAAALRARWERQREQLDARCRANFLLLIAIRPF